MRSARILVTGAGAPGTRGTVFALSKGASSDKMAVSLFGTDVSPENVPPGLFHTTFHLPAPESETYLERLRDLVVSNSIDVVLPQTTREVSRLASGLSKVGVPCVVAGPQAIEMANNKAKVTEIFGRLGLGAPKFRVAHSIQQLEMALLELGYPYEDVVVKVTNSSGGRGVRIVSSRAPSYAEFLTEKPSGLRIRFDELVSALESATTFPELLVTERLEGPEISVDAFMGKSGAIAIPRTRDVIRTGISTRTSLFRDEALSEATLDGASALGLSGVFGFQYMRRADEYAVIECNPRVQGTMVASMISGNNLIWFAVREALGMKGDGGFVYDWTGGTFIRSWGGSLSFEGEDYLI